MDCKERFTYGQLYNTGFVAVQHGYKLKKLKYHTNFYKEFGQVYNKKKSLQLKTL